jgi:hypothetical protein
MNEPTPSEQAAHAELFGNVSRELIRGAIEMARNLESVFPDDEIPRAFIAAGASLAMLKIGQPAAIAMLRDLAATLEAEQPRAN